MVYFFLHRYAGSMLRRGCVRGAGRVDGSDADGTLGGRVVPAGCNVASNSCECIEEAVYWGRLDAICVVA